MRLASLNFDLWQLLQPEELVVDVVIGGADANQQRSPAAIPTNQNLNLLDA